MTFSAFDHPLLGALVGDDEVAGLFTAEAELEAMVAFEAALADAEAALGLIPERGGAANWRDLQAFHARPDGPSLGRRARRRHRPGADRAIARRGRRSPRQTLPSRRDQPGCHRHRSDAAAEKRLRHFRSQACCSHRDVERAAKARRRGRADGTHAHAACAADHGGRQDPRLAPAAGALPRRGLPNCGRVCWSSSSAARWARAAISRARAMPSPRSSREDWDLATRPAGTSTATRSANSRPGSASSAARSARSARIWR